MPWRDYIDKRAIVSGIISGIVVAAILAVADVIPWRSVLTGGYAVIWMALGVIAAHAVGDVATRWRKGAHAEEERGRLASGTIRGATLLVDFVGGALAIAVVGAVGISLYRLIFN